MADPALGSVAPNYFVEVPKDVITFLFILFDGDVISKGLGTERL